MRSRNLNQILSRLHQQPAVPDTDARARLEGELLSRHRQLYERKVGWKMLLNPRWRTGRLVLAALAVAVLGVGACTIPTSYEDEVGKTFLIHVPAKAGTAPAQGELLAFLQQEKLAQDVSVSRNQDADGGTDITLLLLRDSVPEEELIDLLQATFPVLENALFEINEVVGTVETSLAGAFGHAVFNIEAGEADAEAIRQQILEQLAAQGLTGDAVVEIHEDDGQQTVDIEVTAEPE
jgi:hypothetical protein